MKLDKATVAQQVRHTIEKTNRRAKGFQLQSEATLRHRPRPDQWSILDCLDHINLFYAEYMPRLERAIAQAPRTERATYTPGWLGQKMMTGLRPKQGERKMKIKTFRRMNPATEGKSYESVLETFLTYHTQLDALLTEAVPLDWDRAKVVSAVGPLLRFKLGDCFRVLLAHTERHLRQAEEVLEAQSDEMAVS